MTEGYRALRETAALIDLSARGRIKVTGDDRARLLHAMTTNDVKSLTPGSGCYAFFLSSQGRVLADANILCFEDHFLLDVEPESRAFLMEHLDKYIIADDVALEDVTASTMSFGIEGPDAFSFVPVPETPLAHLTHLGMVVVRASSTGARGLRIIATGTIGHRFLWPVEAAAPGVSAAADYPKGAPPLKADPQDATAIRLEHFFPRYAEDITSANLPQETGIADALHFSKGCYLGQEIVERVRSRGHVNRILTGLRVAGDQPLKPGNKITFEGSEVGEVSSAAYSPTLTATVAMGYIRMLASQPGTEVLVDGRAAYCAAIKSSRT